MNPEQNEILFLKYILYVLKESRSKKRAEARILELINKRLHVLCDCIEFTDDMIREYENEEG